MSPQGTPIFRHSRLPADVTDWPIRAWNAFCARRAELIVAGEDNTTARTQAAAEVRRCWEGGK